MAGPGRDDRDERLPGDAGPPAAAPPASAPTPSTPDAAGEPAAGPPQGRRASGAKRAVRLLFAVAVVAGIAYYLRAEGDAFADALTRTTPLAVGGSLVAVLVGLGASMLVWRALLADLGSPLPLRPATHVFFLGQLAKYVPGSVFAIAAQMELARDLGVSRSRTGTASLLFMGVLTAAGLLTAATALPLSSPEALEGYGWALALLPLGLVALAPPVLSRVVGVGLRVLRREPLERPLSARGLGAALGWALVMWLAYGAHLLLLARPYDDVPPLLALGGYALAWTVGFLFLVAPAGGGARELALAAVLAPVLLRPDAAAVVVLSRLVMTLGDVLWGVTGALLRPRVVGSRATVQSAAGAAEAP